jgi:hypothetical protein
MKKSSKRGWGYTFVDLVYAAGAEFIWLVASFFGCTMVVEAVLDYRYWHLIFALTLFVYFYGLFARIYQQEKDKEEGKT